MTNQIEEALNSAIHKLESDGDELGVAADLRAAIEALEKCEPVGWQFYQDGKWHNGMDTNNHKQNTIDAGFPVRDIFTSPQPRDWVELTCEQKVNLREENDWYNFPNDLIEATEAKCKQLNTKG